MFMSRIQNEVKPDPAQMAEIRKVVMQGQREIQGIRERGALEAIGVINQTVVEISNELTPDQQEKFDVMMKSVRQRIKQFMLLRDLSR